MTQGNGIGDGGDEVGGWKKIHAGKQTNESTSTFLQRIETKTKNIQTSGGCFRLDPLIVFPFDCARPGLGVNGGTAAGVDLLVEIAADAKAQSAPGDSIFLLSHTFDPLLACTARIAYSGPIHECDESPTNKVFQEFGIQ